MACCRAGEGVDKDIAYFLGVVSDIYLRRERMKADGANRLATTDNGEGRFLEIRKHWVDGTWLPAMVLWKQSRSRRLPDCYSDFFPARCLYSGTLLLDISSLLWHGSCVIVVEMVTGYKGSSRLRSVLKMLIWYYCRTYAQVFFPPWVEGVLLDESCARRSIDPVL